MKKPSRTVAVILAAGRGERTGLERPKQLLKLAGRPIIEHTIDAFQRNSSIDEILVVTNRDCTDAIESIVASQRLTKVKSVILGGSERYESSLAAIAATEHLCRTYSVKLVFHDAVRPLVSDRIISDVVDALDHYNAVDVVVPTTDTIVSADPISNTIEFIPDRTKLHNGQTPQGFAHETIKCAYEIALKDKEFKTTDDCGVVLKYLPSEKNYLVRGEQENIKLTYAEDLQIMDKLLQLKTRKSSDYPLNAQALAQLKNKVMVVFGGTSGIGADMIRIASAHQAVALPVSRSTGVDIRNLQVVQKCLEDIKQHYGKIDYVINTAAVLTRQPLANMDYAEVSSAIAINYTGAVNVALASFECLSESQGQLLNFTSSSYTYGRAFYSLYSSAKAAVVNLTQALAEEWYPEGIRVNCINPERTDTPMRRRVFGIEPLNTLLNSEEVATHSLAVLLSSTTGQVVDIRRI
jgi:2-C-methyl-D-erythritol 4-phosphate cytidylyltransferase